MVGGIFLANGSTVRTLCRGLQALRDSLGISTLRSPPTLLVPRLDNKDGLSPTSRYHPYSITHHYANCLPFLVVPWSFSPWRGAARGLGRRFRCSDR